MPKGQVPPDPGGYLETSNIGLPAHWHSYSGQSLKGQAAVDKFLQYSDGSSNSELSAMGYNTSGGDKGGPGDPTQKRRGK